MWEVILVIASLGTAVYIYSNKPEDKDRSDAWNEGYKAGFLTPGPFTLIGIFGAGYLIYKKSY